MTPTPRIEDSHLVPVAWVISVAQGDRTVLLDAQSGQYYSLNEVGGEVWSGLCAHESPDNIVNRLAEKYSVAVAIVDQDVRAILAQLLSAKLLDAR